MAIKTFKWEWDFLGPQLVGGLICSVVLSLIGWGFYSLFHYHLWRWVLGSIGLALSSWFVGYLAGQWYEDSSQYTFKCHCGIRCHYFWTEWRHKRNCIKWLLLCGVKPLEGEQVEE